MLGEAGSADIKAAEEFPEKLKKIMEGKKLSKIILIISISFASSMDDVSNSSPALTQN